MQPLLRPPMLPMYGGMRKLVMPMPDIEICEHARLVLDDAKVTTTRVEECSFDSESFDAGSDRLLYPSQR